jgi:hypothetical protein
MFPGYEKGMHKLMSDKQAMEQKALQMNSINSASRCFGSSFFLVDSEKVKDNEKKRSCISHRYIMFLSLKQLPLILNPFYTNCYGSMFYTFFFREIGTRTAGL